ncbi:MAG TPA: DUF1501 domain-containing protein [Gemmataceae bacterium]|jgi:hypothetical protein|nr:DUF1501 domain-containing protein [Gemmataceae bacterium]
MLRFLCDERRSRGRLTRREWLRVGGLAGMAAMAQQGSFMASELAPTGRSLGFGRARSVILVFTGGGVSQLDTFDPKPAAPKEIRGEFRVIPSAVPGTLLCEHLPNLAHLANDYAIVRNMSHDDVDHGSASYLALTGQFHLRKSSNPLAAPTDFPTHGAILKRVRPTEQFPYSAVHINGPLLAPHEPAPGQFGGFLGRANEPLVLGNVLNDAILPGLTAQAELPSIRQEARRSLLQSIDSELPVWRNNRTLLERELLYRQAFAFLDTPRYRQAFDLTQEPAAVRERYGPNRSGQACLLARRLVEVGVPWVTVMWNHMIRGQDVTPTLEDEYGWDTHNDIFPTLKDHLLPRLDRTLSALLEDLRQRGLLDETLVVCMGEFGRAPRIALEPGFAGQIPGRKHWAGVYSVLLAGAGIQGGKVVGASDSIGAYPRSTPYSPCDLAATMFAALGIDPAGHYHDLASRPYVISPGRPILDLYGA